MKTILTALALSLATATAAHAGEAFHRSHEAGLSVYRGAQTLPATLPYYTYEAQNRALALQEQQAAAQARFHARQLAIMEDKADAHARYLRHLERRDTAWLRGNSAYYPRYNRGNTNFGIILNDRTRRNRVRVGH